MEQFVAVGTYTTRHPFGTRLGRAVRNLLSAARPRAKGIYVLPIDGSGALGAPVSMAAVSNPSWLARHPRQAVIYATTESPRGRVSAFQVMPEGRLKLLNERETGGGHPCFASVSPDGRRIYTPNYSSGTVACIAITADGRLGELLDIAQHEGSGPDRLRQAGPHPHAVALASDGHIALVPDLGTDRLVRYAIEDGSGVLRSPSAWPLEPGAGPRHLALHPSGRVAFLVNELASTLVSLRFDPDFEPLRQHSTLPPGWRGHSTAADVCVHPAGRFVYVSNRGWDGIAAFRTDADGNLDPIGFCVTCGRTPRGLAMDPAGRFLLAAHQDSDEVICFGIDAATGELAELSRSSVPTCACAVFL